MKNEFRFNELSLVAQSKAVDEYIKGWEETHETNDLSTVDAFNCLKNDLVDAYYSEEGAYLYDDV